LHAEDLATTLNNEALAGAFAREASRGASSKPSRAGGRPRMWSHAEKAVFLCLAQKQLQGHLFVNAGEPRGSRRFATGTQRAWYAVSFGKNAGEIRAEVYLDSAARAKFAQLASHRAELEAVAETSPSTSVRLDDGIRLAFVRKFDAAQRDEALAWVVTHLQRLRDSLGSELR